MQSILEEGISLFPGAKRDKTVQLGPFNLLLCRTYIG
jgi:hypothetical protein